MRHHIIFAVLFSFMTLCGITQAGVEPSCPSGFSLKNGVCAGAPNICPAGTAFKDGLCTGMPGCPVGSSADNGYCAVVPNCAAGYTYNKNASACTTNPTCPTDFKYSAELGRCVDSAQCISSIVGRKCSCPLGGEYRSEGNICVQGAPTCPAGSRFDAATKACS